MQKNCPEAKRKEINTKITEKGYLIWRAILSQGGFFAL
jgi:hypothetical protein